MIDIVKIKAAVNRGEIRFEEANGYIFCFDTLSGECVCVDGKEDIHG